MMMVKKDQLIMLDVENYLGNPTRYNFDIRQTSVPKWPADHHHPPFSGPIATAASRIGRGNAFYLPVNDSVMRTDKKETGAGCT